jgi:hypothetical protein
VTALVVYACKKDEEKADGNFDISVLVSKFNTVNTTFTVNENTIVITTTSQPDHKIAY